MNKLTAIAFLAIALCLSGAAMAETIIFAGNNCSGTITSPWESVTESSFSPCGTNCDNYGQNCTQKLCPTTYSGNDVNINFRDNNGVWQTYRGVGLNISNTSLMYSHNFVTKNEEISFKEATLKVYQ